MIAETSIQIGKCFNVLLYVLNTQCNVAILWQFKYYYGLALYEIKQNIDTYIFILKLYTKYQI